MEVEQAIKIIKRQGVMKIKPKTKSQAEIREALQCLVEAGEKHIPKELICFEDKYLHCPCCDESLSYKWEKYPTQKVNLDWLKVCWNCGQALKWELNF